MEPIINLYNIFIILQKFLDMEYFSKQRIDPGSPMEFIASLLYEHPAIKLMMIKTLTVHNTWTPIWDESFHLVSLFSEEYGGAGFCLTDVECPECACIIEEGTTCPCCEVSLQHQFYKSLFCECIWGPNKPRQYCEKCASNGYLGNLHFQDPTSFYTHTPLQELQRAVCYTSNRPYFVDIDDGDFYCKPCTREQVLEHDRFHSGYRYFDYSHWTVSVPPYNCSCISCSSDLFILQRAEDCLNCRINFRINREELLRCWSIRSNIEGCTCNI